MLIPRQPVPSLSFETLDHGRFDLAAESSARGTIVCFYRGLHCPVCATYMKDLGKHGPAFAEQGFGTIAISSDDQERARAMADKVEDPSLRVGYGLSLATAREWGLYISTSRGKTSIGIEEPALFSEPGVFIVRADGTLYYGAAQTMPFARPHFAELKSALDFAIKNDYPARGEYTGAV